MVIAMIIRFVFQAFGQFGTRRLMHQSAIDLGADRHFNQVIVNAALDSGFRRQFNARRPEHIADDLTIEHHIGHLDFALDTPEFTQDQERGAAFFSDHVTVDLAIDVQAAGKHQITVDLGTLPDQCVDTSCTKAFFLAKHLYTLGQYARP